MLGLQPARLRPHLQNADRGAVVDEHLRVVQAAEGLRQGVVVALAEEPAPELVRIDPRLGRQHAHEQLLLGHLQAEDPDRVVGMHAEMLRDVEDEGGLAHRRPRRDEDEVGRLEPPRQLVEVDEPARNPGDGVLARLQLVDGRVAGLDEVVEGDESGVDAVVGDAEDRLLRLVEDAVGPALAGVGGLENPVRGGDDLPPRRLLLDDVGVVLDVGGAGHAVDEPRDVRRSADAVEVARPGELVLEGDEVDDLAPLVQVHHLVEHAAVGVAEEVVGVNQLGRLVEGVVLDQDRAEDATLRLEVVGKRPLGREGDDFGHDMTPRDRQRGAGGRSGARHRGTRRNRVHPARRRRERHALSPAARNRPGRGGDTPSPDRRTPPRLRRPAAPPPRPTPAESPRPPRRRTTAQTPAARAPARRQHPAASRRAPRRPRRPRRRPPRPRPLP